MRNNRLRRFTMLAAFTWFLIWGGWIMPLPSHPQTIPSLSDAPAFDFSQLSENDRQEAKGELALCQAGDPGSCLSIGRKFGEWNGKESLNDYTQQTKAFLLACSYWTGQTREENPDAEAAEKGCYLAQSNYYHQFKDVQKAVAYAGFGCEYFKTRSRKSSCDDLTNYQRWHRDAAELRAREEAEEGQRAHEDEHLGRRSKKRKTTQKGAPARSLRCRSPRSGSKAGLNKDAHLAAI